MFKKSFRESILKSSGLQLRRRFRELFTFLHQCFCELTGKGKGQAVRNSDLRQHSFATMPDPVQRPRKRLSLNKLRSKISEKRRVRNDAYDIRLVKKSGSFLFMPAVIVLLFGVLFFVNGGMQKLGGLFSEISLFKVRTLSFTGCEGSSADRLRLLTEINLYQTSLLGLDKEVIAARVEQDPWVSKAVVERNWPSEIVIAVVEHRPLAMINRNTEDNPHLYYVDNEGTAFMEVGPGKDVDFPVITGLDSLSDETQRKRVFEDIHMFLRLAEKNNPNLPAQSISEIHVNEEGDLVVYLVDHTFPIFLGKGQIKTKYSRLVMVLEELYTEKNKDMLISGIEYIRMDYLNDKVLVAQSESG